jgi:hypothetical protein
MKTIAVALAIEIEESLRGTICYFDRAPHHRAKKSDQLVVIHTQRHGQIALEAFVRKGTQVADDFAREIQDLVANLPLQLEPSRPGQPLQVIRFLPGQEIPIFSEIEGFEGRAFDALIPSQRKAA